MSNHPYSNAIEFINTNGGKATEGMKPYRLLHKLAKAKDVYMHGSQAFIGKTFDIKKTKMNKMAKEALSQYCISGVLQIPNEFKYNENRVFRHDGESNANRNVWSESNNAKNDHKLSTPVSYQYNSVKG